MKPLRILLLEDDPKDAEMIRTLLESENMSCELKRVETEAGFGSALEQGNIDLILADDTLPSYEGLSALKLALEKRPDIPFIFVTGTVGEEAAIEALNLGATDWISKPRLSRIVPSVRKALREATERIEFRRSEQALRRSEASLLHAQKISRTGSWKHDLATGKVIVSPEIHRIFATGPGDDVSTFEFWFSRIHPDDRERTRELFVRSEAEKIPYSADYRIVLPDGSIRRQHSVGHPILSESGELVEFVGTAMDVTEQWEARAGLEMALEVLKDRTEDLRRKEHYLAESQRMTRSGSWAWNLRTQELFWSQEMFRIFGYDPENVKPTVRHFFERVHPADRAAVERRAELESTQKDLLNSEGHLRIMLPDGKVKHLHSIAHPVLNEAGEIVEVLGTTLDVTEQWQARAELEMAFEEIKRLKERLEDENVALREQIDQALMFEEIVGGSPALRAVLSRVAKVGPTDSTVLLTGETGTGKELIARAIHKRSQRASRAFVSVNCAAIPAGLIASELFGHERGAFTGAMDRRAGRFELAEEGTLFLDEVGELPAETQVALLRVLQEREFERVGGGQPIRANVRVIAATNRDMETAVSAGEFRSDLFYRLNVFPIHIPALRERREDIPVLVRYFIDRFARKSGKTFHGISKKTLDLLVSYGWPGNIRELQNVIERSVIICEADNFSVDESWLLQQPQVGPPNNNMEMPRQLAAREREMIESALRESGGRVSGPSGAAVKLGVHRSTLESKIASLKIDKYRFKTAGTSRHSDNPA